MQHKGKPYTEEADVQQMVCEPAVAYNDDIHDYEDAPCCFSLDEVGELLAKGEQEYASGMVYTSEEVHKIMKAWL